MAATDAAQENVKTGRATHKPARRKLVEEHARSYFDAIARRDLDAIVEHWSEDGIEDIVPIGVLRGREEIRGFFAEMFAATPDAETTVTRLVADESRAAVEYRISGTFTGSPIQGVEATGGRLEVRGLDLFEIEDGKIVRNTGYYDGMALARQMGLMPPQDSGAERTMKTAFNAVTRIRRAVAERRPG